MCSASCDRGGNYIRPEIVQPLQTDDLSSDGVLRSASCDHSIDYTKLRHFLKAGHWKEADNETYLVMLKVVGRLDGDWIRDEELLNFPCTDLRTIDSLWVKYSNGRFGFSVQKKIYLCVGGVPDGKYYKEAWVKLGDSEALLRSRSVSPWEKRRSRGMESESNPLDRIRRSNF